MSVAAQVARGEGFTTRWLEYPFLQRATLPRPDDFRYPGLVCSLALSFKIFGISYRTALWTVAIIFIFFLFIVFLVCQKSVRPRNRIFHHIYFGSFSLQLYWNTVVYSEGLFGVMTGILLLWSQGYLREKSKKLFWIVLGAGCGALYCIRPNGILFGAGILWLYFTERKRGCTIQLTLIGMASMTLVMLPWLLRTWYWFGNPFHIATNATFFRGSASDSINLSLGQYLSMYGFFYPLKATFLGIGNFWTTLHFFEHGLQILPLIGVAIGLATRRRFFNPFVSASFLVTFIACSYASRIGGSWDGVRFFSRSFPSFTDTAFVRSYLLSINSPHGGIAWSHWPRPGSWPLSFVRRSIIRIAIMNAHSGQSAGRLDF